MGKALGIKIVAIRCHILKAKMYQIRFRVGPLGGLEAPLLDLRDLLLSSKGREGRGRANIRDTWKGRQTKDGDRPPTSIGLKVALSILLQHFAKICPGRSLA